MYAITGITGKVAGVLARSLLAEKLPVRAVLRDEAKAAGWKVPSPTWTMRQASLPPSRMPRASSFCRPPGSIPSRVFRRRNA